MNNALKWKLAFAFLLVFVAGVTTGGLLTTLHVRHHFLGPPHSGAVDDRMREHLRRALDLTPEQAAKIAPIVDAASAKLESIRVETAQRVRNLMEESFASAGYHDVTVDGRGQNGEKLPSGVYFYNIRTAEGSSCGRLTILK